MDIDYNHHINKITMGWKSTIDIERKEAERLIKERLVNLDNLSNQEIEDMLESLGYGDKGDLPYFGHNFIVINNE